MFYNASTGAHRVFIYLPTRSFVLSLRALALALSLLPLLQCPAFARGPLCAVCEPRYVPDSSASDGSCKECNTNASGRWQYKIITVLLAGLVFLLVSLVVVTMPAPSLKIDSFLRTVNVRRIIRRVRKKYLLISIEKEAKKRRESGGHLAPLTAKKVRRFSTMVEQGHFDEAVQFRRAGFVASTAGVAAASLASPAVAGAARGARALLRSGIVDEVGDQIGHTADETIGDAFRGDAADVGAQGLGETIDESGAQLAEGIVGTRALGAISNFAADGIENVQRTAAEAAFAAIQAKKNALHAYDQLRALLSVDQVKLLIGNLQINASLGVVFDIPWPYSFKQLTNFFSVFKLDLFSGLSIVLPCVHSTHYMSVTFFILIPAVLVTVATLSAMMAWGLHSLRRRCRSRWVRRKLAAMPCCAFTTASAFTGTIKVSIIAILFIYPTICSKVFTTFKCIEVDGRSYLAADMVHQCFSGDWIFWAMTSALGMAVYVVGIPLLLLILLFRAHKKRTLYFPKTGIVDERELTPRTIHAHVLLTNDYMRNRQALGNLYMHFGPNFWWFEFCCTMRKMILTGAIVLFGAGTTPQVLLALSICVFWNALIANTKPYRRVADNRMAQMEGFQIFFTLLLGLVLQLRDNTMDSGVLGSILVTLNLAVVALAIWQQPIVYRTCLGVIGKIVTKCHQCGPGGAGCGKRKASASAHSELEDEDVSAAVVGSSSVVELTSVVIREEEEDDDDGDGDDDGDDDSNDVDDGDGGDHDSTGSA